MATEQEYTTVLKSEQRGYKHQNKYFLRQNWSVREENAFDGVYMQKIVLVLNKLLIFLLCSMQKAL